MKAAAPPPLRTPAEVSIPVGLEVTGSAEGLILVVGGGVVGGSDGFAVSVGAGVGAFGSHMS